MKVPAIIAGDANSVLQLAPAGMKNPCEWGQMDSDIIAHFLQVHSQISKSRWNESEIRITTQGTRRDCVFPDFEDFVFAAVYFRQFTAKKDDLLNDAADRYRRFVDCPIRWAWIRQEQQQFTALLDGEAFMLPGYTVRELF